MSDDDDDDDGENDLKAQVTQMLNPLLKKQKKAQKRIEEIEARAKQLGQLLEESLPQMRKDLSTGSSDTTVRFDRMHAELVQCAHKTSVEIMHQEHLTVEAALRSTSDEAKGKLQAHDMVLQAMEARLEAAERTTRNTDAKLSGELSAASAQLASLHAAGDRQRSDQEARVAELSTRTQAQQELLSNRLTQEAEQLDKRLQGAATKQELEHLRETMKAAAAESEAAAAASREQWNQTQQVSRPSQQARLAAHPARAQSRLPFAKLPHVPMSPPAYALRRTRHSAAAARSWRR